MSTYENFIPLLVRGGNVNAEERAYISQIYSESGREKIFLLAKKKKILPFTANTLYKCGMDADFWQDCLDGFRERNNKIIRCLNMAYTRLSEHGVKKMFVSENFGALLSSGEDVGLFTSGDVDNYADPSEKVKIYEAFESLGFTKKERYTGKRQIAADFFPPEIADVPENFYISVDFYPLARLMLPCFIQADSFVDWAQVTRYTDTAIVLPPADALMYICMLHISLHSFSRSPDIRLYIDLLNMSKTQLNYALIRQWSIADQTCTRIATAVDLANQLVKTNITEELVQLSMRREKIEKRVFDSVKNDLIYEPTGLQILMIEALCNDRSIIRGVLTIISPDKAWMKSVYGGSGMFAHFKHFLKVLRK